MAHSSTLPVEIYDQICHYLVEDIGERELHLPTRRHEDSVVRSWEALKSLRLVDRNASKAASRFLFRQLRFPSLMEGGEGGVEADIKRLDGIKASPCLEWVAEISLHILQVWDDESFAWWNRINNMPEGEGLDVAEERLSSYALFISRLPPSCRLTITWTALKAGDEQPATAGSSILDIEPSTVVLRLIQKFGVQYNELVIEPGEDIVVKNNTSVQQLRDDFVLMGRFSKYRHKDASHDAVLRLQGCIEDVFAKDDYLKQVRGCSLVYGNNANTGVVRHLVLCRRIMIEYGLEAMSDLNLTSLTFDENDSDFVTQLIRQEGRSSWDATFLEGFATFLERVGQTLTTVHVKRSFYHLFHYSPYLDCVSSLIWSFFFDLLSRCPQIRELSIEGLTYRRGRWASHICDHHPEINYLMNEATRAVLEAEMHETYGKSTLVLATLFYCDLRSMEELRTHLLRRADEEASKGAATESLQYTADALEATCAVIRKAHEDGRLELLEIDPQKIWQWTTR